MRNSIDVAKRFRRAGLQEIQGSSFCITCGSLVVFHLRHQHDAFHVLVEGIDQTINKATGEIQDVLPPF